MSRGVDGREVFIEDDDRRRFIHQLERITADCSARVIAYCLMGNHYHLAVQVADIPLSTAMQRLLTSYSTFFNLRHDRSGHLFQARHLAKLCLNEVYLQRVIRYIHQNPVRAGFVKKARDWRWSSVDRYADDGSDDDFAGFDPWADAVSLPIAMQRAVPAARAELERLGATISERTGVPLAMIRADCRLRWVIAARRLLVIEAASNGYSLTEVAAWLHTTKSSITRYLANIGHAQG